MTATGPNYYHGSGERHDSKVTHIDASERSIRTTTVIASTVPATETSPDGSTLIETVTLELPVEDNTTTFDVTRDGTYEQQFISTSTGTVHVNALEGSYNGSYVGNSVNEVLNGTLTTTRHANGNITVDGSIEARTHTEADVEASANSFWVDGYKINGSVDPPGQSDLSFYTDDALTAAGSGPNTDGFYGEFSRFDVGEVVSRDIDTHYVFDETFEWTRVAVDQDNDGIHEWVHDTGPIKTETIEVTGSDSREVHHWGVDQIGPYNQTVNQETDVATATNPVGFVNKAATLRGDNSLPGRIPELGGGNEPPPVDDGGSDYASSGGGGIDEGNGDIFEPPTEDSEGTVGREVPWDRLIGSQLENWKEYVAGVSEGFFYDGLVGTAQGIASLAHTTLKYVAFAFDYYMFDQYELYDRSEIAQGLDQGAVFAIEYGPYLAALVNDLPIIMGQQQGELSEETQIVQLLASELMVEITQAIAEELASMSEAERSRLLGRIQGAILFEIALILGTAGAGAAANGAAKAGKLGKLAEMLPGPLGNRIETIIANKLAKLDNAIATKDATRIFSSHSSTEISDLTSSGTSAREVQQKLGRAGLIDSSKVRIIRAAPSEVPNVTGMKFFGWVTQVGEKLLRDPRGRVIIKLTDTALESLEQAIKTVGHEMHHIREVLAGAGPSEAAADAAGKLLFERYLKYLRRGN